MITRAGRENDDLKPREFWEEESHRVSAELRRQAVRWAIVFLVLFAFVFFALWWAGQSVHFSASRVHESTKATWRVYGIVADALTGEPVAFAHVEDDPQGRAPLFRAQADHLGHYELMTVAESHDIIVSALGYAPVRIRAGRRWYAWMPSGDERRDVKLKKEEDRAKP